jgi:hypothetical protein
VIAFIFKENELSDVNNRADAEDTVSLIDVVAVLLRWRKLIILMTGIAIIAGLTIFLILPKAKIITFDKEPSYIVQLDLKILNVPGQIGGYFDTNSLGLSQSYFTTLSMVVPFFREIMLVNNPVYKNMDFEKRGVLEAFLRKEIIGKSLKTSFDGNSMVLTVSYTGKDADRAIAFLAALNEAVRQRISQDMRPKIEQARLVLEEAYKSLFATTLAGTQERILAFSDLQQRRFMLEQLAGDVEFPYQQLGDLVVLADDPEKDGGGVFSARVGFLIFVLGAFFTSVLLAFVLEYIHRIRANTNDMAKLRIALGKK